MIRLFRQKRKQMMEEESSEKAKAGKKTGLSAKAPAKAGRYLKYAIGEIALVVIGILIALSINNWNEKRKENDLKNAYSIRLINDLKKDFRAIKSIITRIEKMQNNIVDFTNSFSSEIPLSEKITIAEEYFTEGWSIVSFSSQKNTYTDLSQTGNMKVFKDTDLREKILSYYSLIDNFTNGYEINKDWVLPIDVAISQETNALGFSAQSRDLYNLTDKASAIHEFKAQEKLLKRHASVHFWINDGSITRLKDMQLAVEELLMSLE